MRAFGGRNHWKEIVPKILAEKILEKELSSTENGAKGREIFQQPISQNHRMFGVGRDLCGSSSPTLLPKQGHLQ